MEKVRIAFGTDHYQKLQQDVVSLVNEVVSRRNCEAFWFDFNKVHGRDGGVYLPLRKFRHKVHRLTKRRMLSHDPVVDVEASFVDAVMIKKDPPQSHEVLKLLGRVCRKTLMLNDPHGILKYESKTYLKRLKKFTVPTFFSRDLIALKRAVMRLGDCVIKKEFGFGGKGVYHVFAKGGFYYSENNHTKKPRRVNLDVLLKRLTENGKKGVLVVKYLKRVAHGDKRILVFDNHILGSMMRVPGQKKGWVCNISSGGYVKRTKLTREEKLIVKGVGKMLKKDGIYMVGIDTLEDDRGRRILSEANTSNAAGIGFIEPLYHRKVSKFVIDWIEKKVGKKHAAR